MSYVIEYTSDRDCGKVMEHSSVAFFARAKALRGAGFRIVWRIVTRSGNCI